MKVTVVRPSELGEHEARRWAAFQQRMPTSESALLSLTFAQVVDRVRGNARVAVVEEGGRIEMFLPFELGRNGVARPIGWRVSGVQGVVGSGAPIDLSRVLRLARLRGWRFHHADSADPLLVPFHHAGSKVPVPVVDLREGWASYLAGRTNQLRRENRRRARHLEREVGPISFEWHVASTEHLPLLIRWKSQQFDTARSLYVDPGPRLILEQLVATVADDCHGGLSVLSAGGRPVALHLGILSPSLLCSYEVAYDQQLARLGPGFLLWFALLERAAEEGVDRVSLGYGAPVRGGRRSYKMDLANGSYTAVGGAAWAIPLEASLRSWYRRRTRAGQGRCA